MRILSSVLLCILLLATSSQGAWQVSVIHTGAVSPVLEGWVPTAAPGVETNEIVDEGGVAAWRIASTGTAGCTYMRDTGLDLRNKSTFNGWRLRAYVRLPLANDAPDQGTLLDTVARKRNGNVYNFGLYFGTDAATNFVYRANGLSGAWTSTPGYHLVEEIYNPTTETAMVYVDGAPGASNYPGGQVGGGTFVRFGSFNGFTNASHWSWLSLDVDDRPYIVDVAEVGSNPRVYWIGATSQLFTLQYAEPTNPAAWSDLSSCRSNVWFSGQGCTDSSGVTGRLYRILQFTPFP